MSKVWKCSECVKHGTDGCYNGSRFEDENCKYMLIDIDYAYEQGRADGIDELGNILCNELNKGYIFIDIHQILHFVKQLKEQSNDNNGTN